MAPTGIRGPVGVKKPAPKKGGRSKSVPNLGPNFNNPTAGLKVPKAKAPPRPKPAKKGPYSKGSGLGVQVRAPSQYEGTDIKVKGGKATNVNAQTNKPISHKQSVITDRDQRQAQAARDRAAATARKAYIEGQGHGWGKTNSGTNLVTSSMKLNNPNSGPPIAQTLHPLGAATKTFVENAPNYTIGPDLTASLEGKPHSGWGLGLDIASLLPVGRIVGEAGQGVKLGLHAEHEAAAAASIARDTQAGLSSEKILKNARKAVRDSMTMGKNKSRVIFERGTASPLRSVVGDVTGPKSRSGLLPHFQNAVDSVTQRAVDRGLAEGTAPAGKVRNFVAGRNVTNLVNTRQHFIDQFERAIPETLKGVHISDTHKMALFMVAHDTPPEIMVEHYARAIAEAKNNREVASLEQQRNLLDDAAKLVRTESDGRVVLHGTNAPRIVHQVLGWMKTSNKMRVGQAESIGALNPETAANRLSAPGRVMRGARVDPETGHLAGAESFTGGQIYVPGRQNERVTGLGRARVSEIVTNKFRKASGLTGEYKGQNLLSGRQDMNVPKLVGEAGLSMQRFYHRTEGLDHLQEIAQGMEKLPTDIQHFQAVKLGNLSHQEKVDLNNLLAEIKQEKMPSRQAMRAAHRAFGGWLDKFLPESQMRAILNTEVQHGWVWKPLTGKEASYAPVSNLEHWLLDVPSGVLKTAIVYTKLPGHIPARRFSNGFFNLAQMGPHLIPIAIKQLLLNHRYPDWATHMQMITGEGSLESIASTKIQKSLTNVVRRWSDANPRRMAVYFELERIAGHSLSVDEAVGLLKQLTEAPRDSKLGQEMINLTQRSTVHAGDYGRMTDVEKRLVSKVLFLWAWHRTAAVTMSKFALEHPLTAGAAGAGTYYLNERVNKGQEPWNKFNVPLDWVPYGKYVGLDGKVSNITTSYPGSQPVQDVKALANIGKPVFGETLGGEVNPFISGVYSTATGRDLETGTAFKHRWQAAQSLTAQFPPAALIWGKKPLQDRILKYFLGNEAPQTAPGGSGGGSGSAPKLNTKQLKLLHKQLQSAHFTPAQKRALKNGLKRLQKR